MMLPTNHTGKRFGRLLAIEQIGANAGRAIWKCQCDCGAVTDVFSTYLVRGSVKSCGCLKKEVKHGSASRGKKTSEYLIWVSMRQRCSNPSNDAYANYGGRGIAVCERWDSFEAFLSDMGPRPSRHTVERMNNSGNYEPGNCRWATVREQSNNRRSNIVVKINGEDMTLKQAVDKMGGKYGTVLSRIHRGMSAEQALGLS